MTSSFRGLQDCREGNSNELVSLNRVEGDTSPASNHIVVPESPLEFKHCEAPVIDLELLGPGLCT
jgi:hypothetical protein